LAAVASSLTLHLSWADTVEKQIGATTRPKDIAYIKLVLFDMVCLQLRSACPFEAELIRQAEAEGSVRSFSRFWNGVVADTASNAERAN
jgi:hypothetical protein